MAKFEPPFPFEGSFGGMSFYQNRFGVWVARKKGGPTKEQVKNSPTCKGIRNQNAEFQACGQANRSLFLAIDGVKHLNDFVLAGAFTKIVKAIQCLQPDHLKGQRNIIFSSNRHFIDGFQLNRKNPFDSVLSNPVIATIVRSESMAVVQLPAVMPGINFRNPWPYSFFRFIVCVGAIQDILYQDDTKRYTIFLDRPHHGVNYIRTDWMPAESKNPGRNIEVRLQETVNLADTSTMIVSVGIEFGTNKFNGVQPVKHAGCAKFVAVG